MKIKSKIILKITSMIIAFTMLTIPFSDVAFAKNQSSAVTQNQSIADTLTLKQNEEVEIIVEFTSPSLIELNIPADSSYALTYEQQLIAEQKAVLNTLGIVPLREFTGVINAVSVSATLGEISGFFLFNAKY